MPDVDVVTGAYSYSGRFITRRLLASGRDVRTLTNHPHPTDPHAKQIPAYPLDFDDQNALTAALMGADTLYNTYWVRAPRDGLSHEGAVENSRRLIHAAVEAGVRRIVHTSIANPTASARTYYRGKAAVEAIVKECGLSYAIVRPTLIFGEGDVLINNIAWLMRHLPVFGIPGNGRYRLQPVHVQDHARIMVEAGTDPDDLVLDSAGPETYSFEELVKLLKRVMGLRTVVVRMPAAMALAAAMLAGRLAGDMLLTKDELDDLMQDILVSHEPPRGTIRLSNWLPTNKDGIGKSYASEVQRHYRPPRRRTDHAG